MNLDLHYLKEIPLLRLQKKKSVSLSASFKASSHCTIKHQMIQLIQTLIQQNQQAMMNFL